MAFGARPTKAHGSYASGTHPYSINMRQSPPELRSLRTSAIAIFVVAGLVMTLAPHAASQSADGPTHTLDGTIIDGNTGKPVEGATLRAWTYGPAGERSTSETVTDAAGHYVLKLLGGKGEIFVEAKGFEPGRSTFLLEKNETVDVKLAPVPEKTSGISGRVIDSATGKPIKGALVNLYTEYRYAASEGKPVMTMDARSSDDTSTATTPPPTEEPATEPAMVRPAYRYDQASTTTDSEGRFKLDAYPGPHRLDVNAPGYANEGMSVDLEEGKILAMDVKVIKIPGFTSTLSGRVVDSKTGAPIEGADVSANNLAWGQYNWTRTEKDGRFTFAVQPGYFQIQVSKWGETYAIMAAEDAELSADDGGSGSGDVAQSTSIVAPGRYPAPPSGGPAYYSYTTTFAMADDESKRVDIKLVQKESATVTVVGYVVDTEKKVGIADVNVNFWNQDTGDWGYAVTDKTGSFRIKVRPGYHTLNAWADGYFQGARVLEVPDETTTRIVRADVEMTPGTPRYGWYGGDVRYASAQVSGDGGTQEKSMDNLAPTPPSAPALNEGRNTDNGATNFVGTGGGLPAYGEDFDLAAYAANEGTDGETTTTPEETPDVNAKQVPGPAMVSLLGIALGVGLVLRRRN